MYTCKCLYVFLISLIFLEAGAQRVELLNSGSNASLRGLSAVNDNVVWVSGTNGTVGHSRDGGRTWKWVIVEGYETRDFRDIEAFDAATAIIMAVGEPAVILKTVNGGRSWKKVYENTSKGMFLDAMEFWNDDSGIVIGDPINGRFFVARSFNGGDSWKEIPFNNLPVAENGEACFAASGTNVRSLDRDEACFVTGGVKSRLMWKGKPIALPMLQGAESQGANSLAVWHKGKKDAQIVVVGGDFSSDTMRKGNCIVSRDGGKTWIRPSNPPYGYRSCVEYISPSKIVTCGISGVDISLDEGINWNSVSSTGFHVCRKAKKGNEVFFAGGNGKIGKLIW